MKDLNSVLHNYKDVKDNEIYEEMRRTKKSYYTCRNKLLEYKNGKPLNGHDTLGIL